MKEYTFSYSDRRTLLMLGMGVKVHIVNCIHSNKDILNLYIRRDTSRLNYNCENEEPDKIYENLSYSPYIQYSTIAIVINCYCDCRCEILNEIVKAIKKNNYIKHKLKLIFICYRLEIPDTKLLNKWKSQYDKNVQNLIGLLNNEADKDDIDPESIMKLYKTQCKHFILDDEIPLRDFLNIELNNMENTLLLQDFNALYSRFTELLYLLALFSSYPLISVQEVSTTLKRPDFEFTVRTKQNNELYFFGINPALAIINNNYIFTNTKYNYEKRKGSEKDVLKFVQELKIAGIPYILTEDFSRVQLLNFINYLRYKDLKLIKSLIFITMTHGSSNNIIYTHDGELNFIKDILCPLQSNRTLSDTHITFVNVHCRGDLQLEHCDFDDFAEIQPTRIDELQANTSIIYSVPNLVASPRLPESGTPFVQSFCKIFREINYHTNVKTFCSKTWNDLKADSYYSYLDCFDKSMDLVLGDELKTGVMKTQPISSKELIKLFQLIKEEFYNLNNGGDHHKNMSKTIDVTANNNFCICANVNETKFSKNLEDLNYFSTKLDYIEKGKFLKVNNYKLLIPNFTKIITRS